MALVMEEMGWKKVSFFALAGWMCLYLLFVVHMLTDDDGFFWLDHINLPFHEAGHIFFTPLGETMHYWGGSIFQLLIPVIVALHFRKTSETAGFAFCILWFGENLLNIARYIADARDLVLPLVGGGMHDWNHILSEMNILHMDKNIAAVVRTAGWIIILAAPPWLLITWTGQEQGGRQEV